MGGGVASTSDGSQLVGACVHAISTQVWWWWCCGDHVWSLGLSTTNWHHSHHSESWLLSPLVLLVVILVVIYGQYTTPPKFSQRGGDPASVGPDLDYISHWQLIPSCLSVSLSRSYLPTAYYPTHRPNYLCWQYQSLIHLCLSWYSHSLLPHPIGHDDNRTGSLIPSCLSLFLSWSCHSLIPRLIGHVDNINAHWIFDTLPPFWSDIPTATPPWWPWWQYWHPSMIPSIIDTLVYSPDLLTTAH